LSEAAYGSFYRLCVLIVFTAALIAPGCASARTPQTELPGVTSVLVAKHGRIIREDYYSGLKAADRVPVFSITKSVTSALVGIALADGRLRSVDERLVGFFPGADPRIRLRHLLSMTAGYGRQLNFGDIDAAALAVRPLVDPPGTRFNYDSGSSDLLAAIVERATGMSLADYARTRLFAPMGIRDVRWPGSHGASGLLLRPRELLAFGQLYLDHGSRHGRRVVPVSWVRASTSTHIRVEPRHGITDGYGYDWWIETHGQPFFAAHGYLGQALVVFPRLDEVVLVTSSREDYGGTLELARRVVRAVHD
jgi:CubicO group peptidase (beta-lactamase class C family)